MRLEQGIGETKGTARPKIAAWKFATGVLIHFSIPVYLVTLLAVCIVDALGSDPRGVLVLVPRASLVFVIVYSGLILLVGGGAAMLSRIQHGRRARNATKAEGDPAVASRLRVTRAFDSLGAMRNDANLEAAIARIAGSKWHHADARYQDVSADLARACAVLRTSHEHSEPSQSSEVHALAVEALERIARRLDDLAREVGTAGRQEAETVVRYLSSKYGSDGDLSR